MKYFVLIFVALGLVIACATLPPPVHRHSAKPVAIGPFQKGERIRQFPQHAQ